MCGCWGGNGGWLGRVVAVDGGASSVVEVVLVAVVLVLGVLLWLLW